MKKYSKMMLAIFAGAMTIASCSSNDDYTVDNLGSRSALFGQETGEISSNDTIDTDTINGHVCVDLGLSVRWATMNVGATEVAGTKTNSHTRTLDCYGEYYAWGETTPKNSYTWSNLKYCSGSTKDGPFTKYVATSSYGTVDNNNTLELTDDAANANWGGTWRMPTTAEQKELIDNCYWEWTSSYNDTGVKGYIVYKVKDAADKGIKKYAGKSTSTVGTYSLSDSHIFLPAAGYREDTNIKYSGSYTFYMSSSLSLKDSYCGYDFCILSIYADCDADYRADGNSVRAVCP